MKTKGLAYAICLLLLLGLCAPFTSACSTSSDIVGNDSSASRRYDVYQQGATSDQPDEFSSAMTINPIDKKMSDGLKSANTSSASEAQKFFSEFYLVLWPQELSYSANNLKKYLSVEEIEDLDTALKLWEESLMCGIVFDSSLITSHEVMLGTQYFASKYQYIIDQYREYVFHIKYMTYLLEVHSSNPVPESEQRWNIWGCQGDACQMLLAW